MTNKKLLTLMCFLLFITVAKAQNSLNITVSPGETVKQELSIAGLDMNLNIKCNTDKIIECEWYNGSEKTLWFLDKTIPYKDFIKKRLWTDKDFKSENPEFFFYLGNDYLTSQGNVKIKPQEAKVFQWRTQENTISGFLTFYTSVPAEKGFLFWKKTDKVDSRLVLQIEIKIDTSCEEIDRMNDFLFDKLEELDSLTESIESEKRTGYAADREDYYRKRIGRIETEVNDLTKKYDKCRDDLYSQLKGQFKRKADSVKLLAEKPKVTAPTASPCSSLNRTIKENTDKVEGLYIKIRIERGNPEALESYKKQLEDIKREVDGLQKSNPDCSNQIKTSVSKFNEKYRGAFNELNK